MPENRDDAKKPSERNAQGASCILYEAPFMRLVAIAHTANNISLVPNF